MQPGPSALQSGDCALAWRILDNRSQILPGEVAGGHPAQLLPKAMEFNSLLAEVVAGKFVDGLPLYCEEKIFADGDPPRRR